MGKARNYSLEGAPVVALKILEGTQRDNLEKQGISEKVYYDKVGEGTIAAVILTDKAGIVARGVTVCSPLDNMNKNQARVVARGRAIRAMRKQRDSGKIVVRPDIMYNQAIVKAAEIYGVKSAYRPAATDFEAALMKPKTE